LLQDPDTAVRRAAIQWVGEEGLKEHVEAARAAASRAPVTKEIFEAFLAATDFLNASERQKVDQTGTETFIARILEDAGQSAALRMLALRMLRPDHPAVTVPKLKGLIAGKDSELRVEAVRTLVTRPDDAAQLLLRESMADPELRLEAIAGLAHSAPKSQETRDLLLSVFEKDPTPFKMEALRSLSGTDGVRDAVSRIKPGEDGVAHKAMLLLGRDPHKYSAEGAGPIGDEPGDAKEGERVFFHPKGPQCYVCHRVNGRGGIVGPDLTTIGNSLNRQKLIESILEPSKEVAPMFVGWKVRTTKGDVLDGRVLYEDPSPTGHVLLVSAQGQQTKVLNKDIEERQPSKISIMPERLHAVLTRWEFRDLVAYMAGLK